MNLTVSGRLFLGFGLVFLLCLALSVTAYLGLDRMQQKTHELTSREVTFLTLADNIQIQMLQHRRFEKDFLLNIGKPQKQAKYLKRFNIKSAELDKNIKALNALSQRMNGNDTELSKRIADLASLFALYRKGFFQVVASVKADAAITPQKANKLMSPHKKAIHNLETNIDAAFKAGNANMQAAIEDNRAFSLKMGLMALIFSILCLGCVAGAGWWISIWTKRDLSKIVGNLDDSVSQLGESSSQVAQSSQEIAQGSHEQAASLEQTSASLEELSSMTRLNADNAGQANQLMTETNKEVEQANASMKQLRNSMEKISHASGETSKIIKRIDEIAFQTNLLALNAAVEAARAGQAGSGFAVVADEVRNLAMRAAEAASSTGQLIQDNIDNVNSSTTLVLDMDKSLDRVEKHSHKVAGLIDEIAAASNEQSQGITELNQGVGIMEQVTSHNAAGAQQFASTSIELAHQAKTMMQATNDLRQLAVGNHKTH